LVAWQVEPLTHLFPEHAEEQQSVSTLHAFPRMVHGPAVATHEPAGHDPEQQSVGIAHVEPAGRHVLPSAPTVAQTLPPMHAPAQHWLSVVHDPPGGMHEVLESPIDDASAPPSPRPTFPSGAGTHPSPVAANTATPIDPVAVDAAVYAAHAPLQSVMTFFALTSKPLGSAQFAERLISTGAGFAMVE
jgi:hypothetical protein